MKYPIEKDKIVQVFSQAKDKNNVTFYATNDTSTGSDHYAVSNYSFDMKHYTNPVKIYINSYPNYLKGNVEIDVPLE